MMDKILLINACVRPGSRTRQLAESVLKKLDGPVEEVCLDGTTLSALGPEGIEKREEASQNGDFSDPEFDLAKQFASADHIVVAAPYWDLMFPGVLKLYLENITVAGITCVDSMGVTGDRTHSIRERALLCSLKECARRLSAAALGL